MVRQSFILQCGFVLQTGTQFLFLLTSLLQDGETIFHIAVWFCMTDWYKFLISLGADRNARDKVKANYYHLSTL